MHKSNLEFTREIEQHLFCKYLKESIGIRRADFVWEQKVLVELKALKDIQDLHLAQVLNYLKGYKLVVALLLNFGSKSLNFKRLFLSWKA